jgi:hypothetical protein
LIPAIACEDNKYNKSVDKTAAAAVNVEGVEEDQEIRSDLIAMIIQ